MFDESEDGQFVIGLHGLAECVTVRSSVAPFAFVMSLDRVHDGRPALPWYVFVNHGRPSLNATSWGLRA